MRSRVALVVIRGRSQARAGAHEEGKTANNDRFGLRSTARSQSAVLASGALQALDALVAGVALELDGGERVSPLLADPGARSSLSVPAQTPEVRLALPVGGAVDAVGDLGPVPAVTSCKDVHGHVHECLDIGGVALRLRRHIEELYPAGAGAAGLLRFGNGRVGTGDEEQRRRGEGE